MNLSAITRHPLVLVLAAALAACGSGDSPRASAQTAEERSEDLRACDLVTKAEIEAILGGAVEEPDAYETSMTNSTSSVCTFAGMVGGVLVRVWHPYYSGEATSAEWAAKLQADRDEDIAEEDDPEMKEMQEVFAGVKFQPLDGLGVPAAFEDMTEVARQVAVHVVTGGKGGAYIVVHAGDLETARAVVEKALARVP